MGASVSQNIASAVSDTTNYISNSTTADASQVNNIENQTVIKDCFIDLTGDFNVKNATTVVQKSIQIAKAQQNSSVNNVIQQKMLQNALSKVGSMGIGFADANNNISEFVNNSNTVENAVSTVVDQYQSTNNKFFALILL